MMGTVETKTIYDIYFTKTQLKERGWTDKLIRDLLGEPDKLKVNYHYLTGPKIQLYEQQRAEKLESDDAWKKAQENREKRKASAQKAVETKRRKLIELINAVEIEVEELSLEHATELAIQSYNHRQSEIGNYNSIRASLDSDAAFLCRITRNYIRHELTSYDYYLDELVGQVGKEEAYDLLRDRVDKEINKVYPSLP